MTWAAQASRGHVGCGGAVDGLLDDLFGLGAATPMGAFDRFARLEVLVRFEEMLDLESVERADVLEVGDVGNPGVVRGHHQDLVL